MSDFSWTATWDCIDCGYREEDRPDLMLDSVVEEECPRCGGRYKWMGSISSEVDVEVSRIQ